MFLNNTRASSGRHKKNSLMNSMYFLAHGREPVDNYKEYLSYGVQPNDHFNNPRNLFDDSNSEDRKWLKITKAYLSRSR